MSFYARTPALVETKSPEASVPPLGIQVSDMRLHHLGLQLQDLKQTLRSCGVQTGSTVQMVVVSKEKAPRKARLFLRGTEMKAFETWMVL